jgi:RND family efflux transporter MFP subunit
MKSINTVFIVLMFSIVVLISCKEGMYDASKDVIEVTTIVETTLIVKDNVTRYHQIPTVFLATNRADLAFQLSGTVDHVMVKIGETVEQGQALMSVYNPNIDPTLESNLAQLESVNAKIIQVKRDVANLKALRKNNSASKNALEQKETEQKDLIAQKKSTNAQIDLAIANQSESIIKAPFDGVIVMLNKQQGEFISAGQVAMIINQPNNLEVEVNIPHSLSKTLYLGAKVNALYENNRLDMTVVELAQVADSQSHLFKVILQLDSSIDQAIGQQVIMNFPKSYENVYKLPLEVVVDDGINQPYIFTVVEGLAVKNPIQPLYIESGHIIFETNGLINDPVVIKGQSKISTGMRLQDTQ